MVFGATVLEADQLPIENLSVKLNDLAWGVHVTLQLLPMVTSEAETSEALGMVFRVTVFSKDVEVKVVLGILPVADMATFFVPSSSWATNAVCCTMNTQDVPISTYLLVVDFVVPTLTENDPLP